MTFPDQLLHTIRENETLAPYTWLQIGGPARYFAEPNTLEELSALIAGAHRDGLPIRLLGSGSNLLVREEGVDGLVIHLATADLCKVSVDGDRLTARSGAHLNHVISTAVGAGLGGLEHLAGIPGTVGAALASNAGVTNDDIGSRVASIQLIDRQGKLQQKMRSDLQFGFRRSNIEDAVIAEVEFKLQVADPAELTRRMQSNWIIRRAAHPTTGSRTVQALIEPDGTNLADVLDAVGLRDAREGDVALSPSHPGFIVVAGQATSKDVLALLTRVTRSVEAKSGIQLQSQLKIW